MSRDTRTSDLDTLSVKSSTTGTESSFDETITSVSVAETDVTSPCSVSESESSSDTESSNSTSSDGSATVSSDNDADSDTNSDTESEEGYPQRHLNSPKDTSLTCRPGNVWDSINCNFDLGNTLDDMPVQSIPIRGKIQPTRQRRKPRQTSTSTVPQRSRRAISTIPRQRRDVLASRIQRFDKWVNTILHHHKY